MDVKGFIFDIRRYTIHDGPGIRTTVFFKGCPLNCIWCHNPEGLEMEPELIHYQNRCIKCLECLAVCDENALSMANNTLNINYDLCSLCFKCVQVCNSEAIERIGREVSAKEVMEEVEKDMIFYETSGGGVTFSGGEPLMQPDFLMALLKTCKKKHIHTALDTSGYAPFELIDKLSQYIDLFLYDLKIIDNDKHKTYISKDNLLILKNLKRLAVLKKNIIIRIPIIPGFNDNMRAIRDIADFVVSLGTIQEINLLPYHKAANEKYNQLKKSNRMKKMDIVSEEKLESIKKSLAKYGLTLKIGG